jgi:protein-disulfide isomerase
MMYRAMLRCWAVLAACGSQPSPASPAPTAGLSQATVAAPTAGAAQPGAAAAIPDSLTPEGYHVLGRPDAPVTLVMYSDFL